LNDEQETINRPSVILYLYQRRIKVKPQIPILEPGDGIEKRNNHFFICQVVTNLIFPTDLERIKQ